MSSPGKRTFLRSNRRDPRRRADTPMERNVGLRSFNDPIDTTTSQGRLGFNLFASLAELEHDLIRERTQAA